LVEIIKQAVPAPARRSGGNPAKRTFQALRIAVNAELDVLRTGLEAAIRWLNPGGRIVVISYHSLEDRIVKQQFANLARRCTCPPEAPVCTCNTTPVLTRISTKPLVPTSDQIAQNPRSKSAKLRWAVKV
jgi:16S rRNA (cytosine1402-N4)-methyltransferase